MFKFFKKKKEIEGIKEETKKGFDSVKKDIVSISGWIKHLDSEKDSQKKDVGELKEEISTIKEEIENMKEMIYAMNDLKPQKVFKQKEQVSNKQTAVYPVQTAVQTAVQTPNLDLFSVTERAIIWILLNTDMRLSYDDIAAVMGKEKSTIRGQINTIKQKSESLVKEITEKNGKKRVYIPEEYKEKLLKKSKVRVKNKDKDKKKEKKEEKSQKNE